MCVCVCSLLQLEHIPHLELWLQLAEAHLKIQGIQRKVKRSPEDLNTTSFEEWLKELVGAVLNPEKRSLRTK